MIPPRVAVGIRKPARGTSAAADPSPAAGHSALFLACLRFVVVFFLARLGAVPGFLPPSFGAVPGFFSASSKPKYSQSVSSVKDLIGIPSPMNRSIVRMLIPVSVPIR